MKRYLLLLLAAGALCAFAGIDWRIHDKPIIRIDFNGEPTVELGLRDDGVVVWRKITQATNSPAETVKWSGLGATNKWSWTNFTVPDRWRLDTDGFWKVMP